MSAKHPKLDRAAIDRLVRKFDHVADGEDMYVVGAAVSLFMVNFIIDSGMTEHEQYVDDVAIAIKKYLRSVGDAVGPS